MPAHQGHVLVVGQPVLIAISLVRGSHNDLFDAGTLSASFQEDPRALDVGLKRRNRIAIGNAHDCLGSEVDDGIDLIFTQDPRQQGLVANVTADHLDLFDLPGPHQFALGHPVAHQCNHIGSLCKQTPHHPRAHQSRAANYQSWTILPERCHSSPTFQDNGSLGKHRKH
jgi:hypothetical protein